MIPVLGALGSESLLCLTMFQACWQCLFLALQPVSGCQALLTFQHANDVYPWFSGGEWLPSLAMFLLAIPVLDSSGSEWLSWLTIFFKPVYDTFALLSSLCVVVMSSFISIVLMTPVSDSSGSGWLPFIDVFQPCWQYLSLVIQGVCAHHLSLYFKPADKTYHWLYRK